MRTVREAYENFRSNLEITKKEQEDASRRHKKICNEIKTVICCKRIFLTGSYKRNTKTKPLKDVDIFVVLDECEVGHKDKAPYECLSKFKEILLEHYDQEQVGIGRRSVQLDFGVDKVADLTDKIVSFDIVPAFEAEVGFEIPDTYIGSWIGTDPTVHMEKVTEANTAFEKHWVPAIKMIKKWNEHHGKPIKPSFLLEVMALELLVPPWAGPYPHELRQFFATAVEDIDKVWADPADLGPPVSDRMDDDLQLMTQGRDALRQAEKLCTQAMKLERESKVGASLEVWQELFGPFFAKS